MKSSLKMFCVLLMSAGLMIPACKKQEEAVEEEAAVEVAAEEEAAEEEVEEEAEEEEVAEEADVEEAAEGDAGEAAEGDATAEAEGEEKAAEAKKPAPKPATPAHVGRLKGSVGAIGLQDGAVELVVTSKYDVTGTLTGKSEGNNIRIPFRGKLSKDNKITAEGKSGQSSVKVTGDVRKGAAGLQLNGSLLGKPFKSQTTVK